MRPVRLIAEGFAAFRERIDIDFTGADFFVLLGPTGSGKSSVIDAICFALYGCVPRYDNQNLVAPAITIGALEAKVALEFEAGGVRYLATRVVRRQGKGATTKEARLERVADGSNEVLAGNPDELERRVETILGLPFDHFTKCVVLPQGEFARFLHDKPSARQDLLARLLNLGVYTNAGERARALAEVDKTTTALQRSRLDDLAFATPEADVAARERHKQLRQLGTQIHKVTPKLEQLERDIATFGATADEASGLAAALAKVIVPAAVVRLAGDLEQLRRRADDAAGAVEQADARQAATEHHLATLADLGALRTAAAAHAQLQTCIAKANQALSERDHTQLAEKAAADALGTATTEATEAVAALHQAQLDHAAHNLAGHLVKGQPCPVCLQPVGAIPRRATPAHLRRAQQTQERAEETLKAARADHTRAATNLAAARARAEELDAQQEQLRSVVAAHPDPDALARLIGTVEAATAAVDQARSDATARRKQEAEARKAVETAAGRLEKSWNLFDGQRDPVVSLGPPKPARRDLKADWAALAAWAGMERPRQLDRASAGVAEIDARQVELDRGAAGLVSACQHLGVSCEIRHGLMGVREALTRAETDAKSTAERIAHALVEVRRLQAQIATLEEEAAVAAELGRLLSATGFERWLVAEALDALVVGASATLERLSSGQYALARDERNEFLVIDHANADETRSAKTLSGGETFQASLALALALADQLAGMAAEGGAQLDSIFLDEGFGTLDPDTLAVVADTIETLGHEERMVGVITHVRELAERIPVRFVVTKGPRTSTVERVTS